MPFSHSLLSVCMGLGMTIYSILSSSAEPLELVRPIASYHAGSLENFSCVIDGIPSGPAGWSVAGKTETAQSLVVSCATPLSAAELDITLFFLAGRPFNYLAGFHLSYTTDENPALESSWHPLEILRFTSEATTLQRISSSALRASQIPYNVNGGVPDETYRLTVALPRKNITGFRLTAVPVPLSNQDTLLGHSYYAPYDFTLTEFRVAIHRRESTNIALHCPVISSHLLYRNADGTHMQPQALTDGLPATIAHPGELNPDQKFFFEIDLQQMIDIDHIGLRNRGDEKFHRLSQVHLSLYQDHPTGNATPSWEGIILADGSHPAPGALEIIRASQGKGRFQGRYLRISSQSPEPYTPQLAEVEVYPKTTPKIVSITAEGRKIPTNAPLDIPPGTRRLQWQLEIPQKVPTHGDLFRWRIRGQSDEWTYSRSRTIDIPCPDVKNSVFEAQALHTDGEWDQSLLQIPIVVREYWWKNIWLRIAMMITALFFASGAGILWSRYRTARQVAAIRAESALSDERARIARDMHDDVGGKLARLAMLGDLALHQQSKAGHAALKPIDEMTNGIREVASELEQVIWSLKPGHDCLDSLARRIYQYAEEFFAGTPIRCRFGSMDHIPQEIPLMPEMRNELFRSCKEALANILKHSQAQTAYVEITRAEQSLQILIADDGTGFDASLSSQHRPSHGIANMRQRMGAIGGSCTIDSGPMGSTVIFRCTP